jgi:hypothetical protein
MGLFDVGMVLAQWNVTKTKSGFIPAFQNQLNYY